jgi:hypothetical protein
MKVHYQIPKPNPKQLLFHCFGSMADAVCYNFRLLQFFQLGFRFKFHTLLQALFKKTC